MNFKARTLKKNSLIFGFGRGAQVGEASFLEMNLRRTLGVSFIFGTLQALGSLQTSVLEEVEAFFNNAKQESETTTLLAPMLCHINACGLDVLTTSSNVHLNLGLNQFHSYF